MADLVWNQKHNEFIHIFTRDETIKKMHAKVHSYRNKANNALKAPMNRYIYYDEHERFPGLNSVVGFKNSRNRGRYAITNEEIPACRKIGAVEAFASVVDKTEIPYCLTCHKTEVPFQYCDDCQNVVFCSQRCMDQNSTHTYECGSNFHNTEFGADIDIKCAIQMVFQSLTMNGGRVPKLIDAVKTLLSRTQHITHPIPTWTDTPEWRFKCIMRLQANANAPNLLPRTYQAYVIIMQLDEIASLFRSEEHREFLQHLLAHFLTPGE